MLSFLRSHKSKKTARILNDLCCLSFASTELGLHRFLSQHPFVRESKACGPEDQDVSHRFWFHKPLDQFEFAILRGTNEGKGSILIRGIDDYAGAMVQAVRDGRYLVSMSPPLSRPFGKLAGPLLQRFLTAYDASDVTDPHSWRRYKSGNYVR